MAYVGHEYYRPHCKAIDINWDKKIDNQCTEKAMAIYMCADSTGSFIFVCGNHRAEALVEGDGPVFDLVEVEMRST